MEMKYEGIKLMPADNGGYVLSYHTYKPALKHSHSMYKDHSEAFTEEEEEKALARITELHKMNLDHYKKPMSNKKKSHKSHNPGTHMKSSSYR